MKKRPAAKNYSEISFHLTVGPTADAPPLKIAQFCRWIASDIEDMVAAGQLNKPIHYTYDPQSDYVTACEKRTASVSTTARH